MQTTAQSLRLDSYLVLILALGGHTAVFDCIDKRFIQQLEAVMFCKRLSETERLSTARRSEQINGRCH